MANYTLYNQSTVINNSNLQSMVKAINNYLITLCNDWGLSLIKLNIGTYNSHQPLQNNSIFIYDTTDQEDALGYHYETDGNSVGRVFAKTILDSGGAILWKDNNTFTVAQCLSHELLEMIGNPMVNKWYLDNYSNLWAGELCDPVESNLILYSLPGNIKVGLSDYVLPTFFSPDSISGPYNKINTLFAPFMVDNGGYALVVESVSGDLIDIYGMGITYSKTNLGTQSYILGTSSMTYAYGTHSITYGVGTYSSNNKLLTMQANDRKIDMNKRSVRIVKKVK